MRHIPASVWLFALALAAITTLPYLVGAASAPAGWVYSGALPIPSGVQVDFNSHIAKMWQGARGEWAYRLLFTHEPHPGLPLVQGFYVALGALASLTPFSLTAVYHIARFALTAGLTLALWAFASHFFERPAERWLALLFGTVVSGWSWLLLVFDPALTAELAPIEFWLLDAYNLFGAQMMPHFAAAVILQVAITLAFEHWARSGGGRWRLLALLTLALAASAVIQPYGAALFGPLLLILAAYHVFSARRLPLAHALRLALPFGVYGALTIYQALAINGDPVWAGFSAQNQTLSPLVSYYLLGYLPFILPAAFGARRWLASAADDRWWLPILWVGLAAALLYAPFPTQRRYLLGVQTPLAVIAAYGWSRAMLPWIRPRLRLAASAGYFTLAGAALAAVILTNVLALTHPEAQVSVYDQPDERQGYAWLRREADPDDLVVTTFGWDGRGSGGRLAAAVGQRVFAGHWIETVNFDAKIAQLRQFYDPDTPDAWRRAFLTDIGAVYVWVDVETRALGGWDLEQAAYLQPVFRSGQVTIYRVLGL